jgi:hypothetical protein
VVIKSETGASRAFGTGFLVAPGLVMTCAHMIPDLDTAAQGVIEFDYVEQADGVFPVPKTFAFAPERVFVADLELDFTVIAVSDPNGDALSGRPFIPLDPRPGELIAGEEINLVHHALAEPLEVVVRGNVVRDILDDFIHFDGSTKAGSGGAPVMNDQWELVAVHHALAPVPDGSGAMLCEAIRISSIVKRLVDIGARDVLGMLFSADDDAAEALAGEKLAASALPPSHARSNRPVDVRPETFDTKLSRARDTVFLCYARDDQGDHRWVERLDRQLRGISRFKEFSVWHDGRIAAGLDWRAEIDVALQRCGAAVLLIGPAFLTSDFIHDEELPVLLRAQQEQGVAVFPLITNYSTYRLSPLARFQSVNDPGEPLEALEAGEQNRILLDVAERVAAAFDEGTT